MMRAQYNILQCLKQYQATGSEQQASFYQSRDTLNLAMTELMLLVSRLVTDPDGILLIFVEVPATHPLRHDIRN